MKTLHYILSLLLLSLLYCSHEDRVIPPSNGNPTDSLLFIGLQGKLSLDMKYEDPFLYVCAGSRGVWRRSIVAMTEWEYLGLKDTTLGNYTNRGALNLDVLGGDILVSYNGPTDTLRPDQSVGIWRSTNAGMNWIRSDNGIPESIIDTFECNIINDLERSPHKSGLIVAVYGPARYISSDDGYNWEFYGIRGVFVNKDYIRWNPFKVGEFWQFGVTSVFAPYLIVSRDNGLSFEFGVDFTQLGFPSDGTVTGIAFDKLSNDIIYVAINGQLIKSTNGGYDWILDSLDIPSNGSIWKLVESKTTEQKIFFGGNNKLYITEDGGTNINILLVIPFGSILSLELDESENQLFVGTSDGIFIYYLNKYTNK